MTAMNPRAEMKFEQLRRRAEPAGYGVLEKVSLDLLKAELARRNRFCCILLGG